MKKNIPLNSNIIIKNSEHVCPVCTTSMNLPFHETIKGNSIKEIEWTKEILLDKLKGERRNEKDRDFPAEYYQELIDYIDEILKGNNPPISNKSQLLIPETTIICRDSYSEIISKIAEMPALMEKLDPRKFEEIVAELLYRMGYKVELTNQTRDGGYDILAIDHTPIGLYKIAVECKRYLKDKVGVDVIRGLYGVKEMNNFNQGMIVTTSSFTKDACLQVELIANQILIKDKNDFSEWCKSYSSL
jgi:HJR/Mrr/RecB family endonuclease